MRLVGAVSSAVEVPGGATLIETETARMSETKDYELVDEIPADEKSSLTIYFNASNALNHTNCSNPGVSLSSP